MKALNRREALKNFGLLGAGAAMTACVGPVVAQPTDIDDQVLNFALNLEYLEAEFYLQAAFGRNLNAADTGGGPTPVGGRKLQFSANPTGVESAVQAYIEEIAIDEENHVKFLRAALGSKAVARPALDIGAAFNTAASAASGGAIPMLDPYANFTTFLLGAFIFEDVGVTAYKGAARLITNKDFLEAAAGILGVEAYHAGEVRTLLFAIKDQPVAAGLNVGQVVQAISNLRDTLGGSEADQGIVEANGKGNILPTDANSIAFSRSTRQVLNIVYGAANASSGLFFPNGMNGAIK